MKKILLVDESEGGIAGHNGVYRNTLLRIPGTEVFKGFAKFPSLVRHPVSGLKKRWSFIKSIPNTDIICLLHLDTLYSVPFMIKKLKKKSKHMVGVLHWYPRDKKRFKLLLSCSRYLDFIIVHSEYIEKKLNKMGVKNTVTINYPVFCNVEIEKMIPQITPNKKVFTCLGGSRLDKGPDILAESFKYIPKEARDNIQIVIAGKELDVPFSFIESEARKNGIDIQTYDRRMSDEEYWQFIVNTDVMLLPYKRIFTGNSGPMTDGISLNKYILGPSEGNIGFLINKYKLGSTFAIEDPKSLGAEIGRVGSIDTICNHEFRKKLSVDDFVRMYQRVFDKLN